MDSPYAKGVASVSICTLPNSLPRRKYVPSKVVARITAQTPRTVTTKSTRASKLEAIEEKLLAEAFDHHRHRESALDAALDDMAALSAEVSRSRQRPLLLRSTARLGQIEDLLLAAIIRTHPNGERALDRLMADVSTHDGDDEEPEPMIDNDFDGLS
jgi:hypothetical protein